MKLSYGILLTTPDKYGTQKKYHTVSYINPTTLASGIYSNAGGPAVLGTAYESPPGLVVPIPHWSLVNNGQITARQYNGFGQAIGVYLTNGGSISDAPTIPDAGISGDSGGVLIIGSTGSVSNHGTILAAVSGAGIDLAAGGDVTNYSNASIKGITNAVYVSGATGTVTNYGTLTGTNGVYLAASGTVTNTMASTAAPLANISGSTVGVIVGYRSGTFAEGSIFNNGVIQGATGIEGLNAPVSLTNEGGGIYGPQNIAVYLKAGGRVLNANQTTRQDTDPIGVYTTVAVGTISGLFAGVDAVNASAEVSNYGLITATRSNATAIELGNGGRVANYRGGTITAGTGILLGGYGNVINRTGGLIVGTQSYSSSFAVRVNGFLSNDGSIHGGGGGVADGAVLVGGTWMSPTVLSDGTITARYSGVAINAPSGAGKPNASFYGVNPTGFVQGGDYGVAMANVTGTADNVGTIRANGGVYPYSIARGLAFSFSNGTIFNGLSTNKAAYIYGKIVGVNVDHGATTIINYGTIKGLTGISTYGGTYNNTVFNFGTIISTNSFSPRAVFFGKGNSKLVDEPGAVFIGDVIAGAGTNVLSLAPGSSAGTATGLGISFANFGSIVVRQGANWYVDGTDFDNQTNAGGTVTNYGTLNVNAGRLFSNFGMVAGGITLQNGATLKNNGGTIMAAGDAVVEAYDSAVFNYATITDTGSVGSGVSLKLLGTITNGTKLDTEPAIIAGALFGVDAAPGAIATVTNFGTITGHTGVNLDVDGELTNGASAATTALIAGTAIGVKNPGTDSTVTNFGTITGDFAVVFDRDDTLINGPGGATAALIAGTTTGVYVKDHSTVTNDATIIGTNSVGVFVFGQGEVNNSSTAALISGGTFGIYATTSLNSETTISNLGTITSPGTAVGLFFGSSKLTNGTALQQFVTIAGGAVGIADDGLGLTGDAHYITNYGTITGATGIKLYDTTTLTNFGTIIGSNGTAVSLGPHGNRLIDEPGGKFVGKVDGGGGTNAYLDLAGDVAATGYLGDLGTSIVNFHGVQVDGSWRFTGNSTITAPTLLYNFGTMIAGPSDNLQVSASVNDFSFAGGIVEVLNTGTIGLLSAVAPEQLVEFVGNNGLLDIGDTNDFAATIQGFVQGDEIDLVNLVANNGGWQNNVLTVTSGGIHVATLNLKGNYAGMKFSIGTDNVSGTAITLLPSTACFAAGTRITTRYGDMAVEDLREGDMVWTQHSGWIAIKWLGHRHIDCHRHPKPTRIWPVRIAANAFDPADRTATYGCHRITPCSSMMC